MGYTHYMNTKKEIPQQKWNEEFLPAVKLIIAKAQAHPWEVPLAGPMGEINTFPEYRNDRIMFNGFQEDSHETMCIERKPSEFYFCKTARKPYDCVCVAIMVLTETLYKSYFSWSSDGEGEDYRSEGERLLYQTLKYEALNRHGLVAAIQKSLKEKETVQ